MTQELLMECAYDWGKVFRLYRDHVQIHDTTYALSDLLAVEPIYHRFMGVSSARLTLQFKEQTLTLRGIAEVDALRQAVVFLDACALHHDSAIEPITEYIPSLYDAYTQQQRHTDDVSQEPTRPVATPPIQLQRKRSQQTSETSQQATRSLREHHADIKLLMQRFKDRPLPTVPVPLRLQRDEYALYVIPATNCQETAERKGHGGHGRQSSTFEPKDQGMLIFTSRRVIYMGRTGQLTTDYARLLRVSYQQDSVTIHTEHWHEGNVFAVRRPLECCIYLEAIIECFREEWSMLPASDEGQQAAIVSGVEQPYVVTEYAYNNTSTLDRAFVAAAPSAAMATASFIGITDWTVAE